jgi:hypothetical protein
LLVASLYARAVLSGRLPWIVCAKEDASTSGSLFALLERTTICENNRALLNVTHIEGFSVGAMLPTQD